MILPNGMIGFDRVKNMGWVITTNQSMIDNFSEVSSHSILRPIEALKRDTLLCGDIAGHSWLQLDDIAGYLKLIPVGR